MNTLNVLIFDYSVDRSEAPLFRRWLPDNCASTAVCVYFGDSFPDPLEYSHVMHTGSSLSICSDAGFLANAENTVRKCVAENIPQMGVCYGHQLISRSLLGSSAIGRCPNGLEAGWIDVEMTGSGLEIPGVVSVARVLQSHFDRVEKIPDTSEVIATNDHTEIQGFVDREKNLFSLQFHPEFTREEGNRHFLKEARLLEENGIDLESVLDDGPSLDTGKVFFEYFLNTFRNPRSASAYGHKRHERSD
ncbi:MAG: type 1 glutamine amidotransferase [Candidatus Aegiribacteria sp.]|nr:type 1 glutamine amidotransferase [Candidatus Aegiribacteria sp.]